MPLQFIGEKNISFGKIDVISLKLFSFMMQCKAIITLKTIYYVGQMACTLIAGKRMIYIVVRQRRAKYKLLKGEGCR